MAGPNKPLWRTYAIEILLLLALFAGLLWAWATPQIHS